MFLLKGARTVEIELRPALRRDFSGWLEEEG